MSDTKLLLTVSSPDAEAMVSGGDGYEEDEFPIAVDMLSMGHDEALFLACDILKQLEDRKKTGTDHLIQVSGHFAYVSVHLEPDLAKRLIDGLKRSVDWVENGDDTIDA